MTNESNNSELSPGANERFEEIGRGCYAFSADGCSNTGVIVGERGVLIVDAQATPELAAKVLEKIREKTDKPIKQVVLTHFHADSTLGAQAFDAGEIVASDLTRRMMDTRGAEEILVARDRLPGLFSGLPSNVGVSLPSMTIASSMSIDLGNLDVRLMHLGRGHTMGDVLVWVPGSSVIFAGDLVQTSSVPYCGDAHLADWPRALDRITAFRPTALMPGRGRSAIGASAVAHAIENTREFVTTLQEAASACVEQRLGLKDTFNAVKDALGPQFGSKADFDLHLSFNVARAYDEALGLDQPQIWSRERCADLKDALDGVVNTDQPVENETELPASEEAVDDVEARITAELVSDNDFAASLLEKQASEETDEEEILDLSTNDIVGPEAVEYEVEETESAEHEADEPRVLMEAAR
ncbi:MBL fold metallo-hydrolase [uncultured Roseibium sp.]|uniref:MBL fold metallo-hydrolase n=1 Tax=uncultured Roseibium sp. TaxID=1936171 RepID=UPI00260838F6|nr:MBL fold metallo-hydrolase [uncultured Roseibium sp.]